MSSVPEGGRWQGSHLGEAPPARGVHAGVHPLPVLTSVREDQNADESSLSSAVGLGATGAVCWP
jgi:hypothetical protein